MIRIGIYGKVNAGKSTLLNALTGQQVSIVDPQRGTTTDPVRRAFEILNFAPVTFIDTAGFDDKSPLGRQRLKKTVDTIQEIDLALYVGEQDKDFLKLLDDQQVPYIVVERGYEVDHILESIKQTIPASSLVEPAFYGDKLKRGETVVLVCPIDSEAPSGRLILPQVQAIRAALDLGATAVVTTPEQLAETLKNIKPRLIVTDSQAFDVVRPQVPKEVTLTSFSILLAELKGDVAQYKQGLSALQTFKTGDRVLIVENCSHQTTCHDIGRVKIPRLLGAHLQYTFVSGRDPLPENLSSYALVVQCGGCMTTRRVIQNRIERCRQLSIPITNYGMLLRELL